ncbi:MAG: hypothetical protein IKK11_04160 [Oscillospiraceae bacterium]|nr:hypothetical protein [Oscillospiraceae bacterium]
MKKYICLLLVLLCFLSLVGCKSDRAVDGISSDNSFESNTTPNDTSKINVSEAQKDAYFNTFENFERTFTTVRVNEKNFLIKTSADFAGDFYEIYDNNGNLLDKGFHGWRGSFDITKENDIITLEYGYGGTNVHPKFRLYDAQKGIASRYFEGPIAVNGTLIAYFDVSNEEASLIVQDVFDVEKNYKEFSGKFDRFILMKIQEISFCEDGTKIHIKYCETNNESNIIEETFILD